MLLAFHSDPAIKQKYVDRVKHHQKLDAIRQGWGYWNDEKGCAVGCTLESACAPHVAYETELGIPAVIARLEDRLFENLPSGRAANWPLEFLEAIEPGADLYPVFFRLARWLLTDSEVRLETVLPTLLELLDRMERRVYVDRREIDLLFRLFGKTEGEFSPAALLSNGLRMLSLNFPIGCADMLAQMIFAPMGYHRGATAMTDKLLELLRDAEVPGKMRVEETTTDGIVDELELVGV